jgi:acyl-CoA thioesterase I
MSMLWGRGALGAAHGLPVFRRGEVMKYWLDGRRFTPATMLSAGQLHMTDAQLPLALPN